MPRIDIPTRDEAPAETHAVLDTVGKRFGFVPNLIRLMAMSPPALDARDQSTLNRRIIDARARAAGRLK